MEFKFNQKGLGTSARANRQTLGLISSRRRIPKEIEIKKIIPHNPNIFFLVFALLSESLFIFYF